MDLEEAKKIQKGFRLIVYAVIITLASGTLIFSWLEDWSYVDAFYFSTVSLLTVGYGDLVPTTDLAKMITVLYLLIGISILAAFINNLVKGTIARRELKQNKEKK